MDKQPAMSPIIILPVDAPVDPDPYYTHILGNSPTYYWPLRETSGPVATEEIVGTTPGTNGVYNNVTFNQNSLTNATTKAVTFAGNTCSYVGALGQLDNEFNFIHQTGIFTISGWINADTLPAGNSACIIGNEPATSGVGFAWLWDDSGSPLINAFRLIIARNTGGSYAIDVRYPNIPIVATTTYHVAVKGDGTNFWFYVNGTEFAAVGTFNYGYFLGDHDREPDIARLNFTTPLSPFDGIIEDLAIWNTTLTAGNILAQYNAGL